MGFDCSFHPVDPAVARWWAARVTGRPADDAPFHARIAAYQERWALAAQFKHALHQGARDQVPAFCIWGRPLFITATDPVAVVHALDRLEAAPGRAAFLSLLEEQAAALGLAAAAAAPGAARTAAAAPDPDPLARTRQVLARMQDLFRETVPAAGLASWVFRARGQERRQEAMAALAANLPFSAAIVTSELAPMWYHRGTGFTHLVQEDVLPDLIPFLETPRSLFPDGVPPEALGLMRDRLTENYTAGAYIRPEEVPAVRAFLAGQAGAVLGALAGYLGSPEAAADLYACLAECAEYAARRGWGILEATDVIVPMEGGVT